MHLLDGARPAVAVNLVIFSLTDSLRVLAVRRDAVPFQNQFELPGGLVLVGPEGAGGEGPMDAVRRVLRDTVGNVEFLPHLVGVYGEPHRDPRTRVLSIAYVVLLGQVSKSVNGEWLSVDQFVQISAFDHTVIVSDSHKILRASLESQKWVLCLLPKFFTIDQARQACEAVSGRPYNAGNFRRQFLGWLAAGAVEVTPDLRMTATKPSRLYRIRDV